eukprot:scaffold1334_cov344-Prasinococcus_capsulatus_cf.AAC.21
MRVEHARLRARAHARGRVFGFRVGRRARSSGVGAGRTRPKMLKVLLMTEAAKSSSMGLLMVSVTASWLGLSTSPPGVCAAGRQQRPPASARGGP